MSDTETPAETAAAEPEQTTEATEAAATPEPAAPPQDDAAERARKASFAEARRYKRDLESRVAARERELAEERAALQAEVASAKQTLQRLKSGQVLEALYEIGVDTETLVAELTAAATQTPEQRRMAQELRELREERKREQAEREQLTAAQQQAAARQQLHAQVSEAVEKDPDPRLARLRAENPAGAKEFARAVAIRAEAAIARGERVTFADVAEAVWSDARRTYDLARIAFRDEEPAQAAPAAQRGGKQPPKPGGGALSAKGKDLASMPPDKAVAALLSMSDAEIEQLARG